MSKIMTWCSGLALVGAVAGCGQPAAVRTAGSRAVAIGSWGRAITVPGLGALNKGRNAGVLSVSCPSAGSCAAGGDYRDGGGHQQGFVAVERNGRWRLAIEAPGLGALNKNGNAEVSSVSCASPGYCAAGGYFGNRGSNPYVVSSGRGFVVSETNGRWGRAVEVPGLGFLNKGGNADVSSVSCAGSGNCAAGGDYTSDASGRLQAFVVSETGGSWGTAQEVAGNVNTGAGLGAIVDTVSCASAGNCSAGGTYDYGGYNAAFLVSEKNGVWGQGINVPGLSKVARDAYLTSVSCASAGNCAAGGSYDGGGSGAWVVREKNGVWGQETTVPGLGALNKGSVLGVSSVSCSPAGSCVAGIPGMRTCGPGRNPACSPPGPATEPDVPRAADGANRSGK